MQSFRLSGSYYKTKENTLLSEINPGDIEILSSVDKPQTKISLCPIMSSCFHTDVSWQIPTRIGLWKIQWGFPLL